MDFIQNNSAMRAPFKILLAEDDTTLGTVVRDSLEVAGYQACLCRDGEEALKKYLEVKPDLLILDVMMPKKDGFTLATEIRNIDKQMPILFLTAKSRTQDVVTGFESGGNDYMRKPFGMEELIVRIKSLLGRRVKAGKDEISRIGNFYFNYSRQTLTLEDNIWELSNRETELLYQLSENRGHLLDRNVVLKELWRDNDFYAARSMDVYISKLRKRLAPDSSVKIVNIRSYGFKLIC